MNSHTFAAVHAEFTGALGDIRVGTLGTKMGEPQELYGLPVELHDSMENGEIRVAPRKPEKPRTTVLREGQVPRPQYPGYTIIQRSY
jgi:hypothetical protein